MKRLAAVVAAVLMAAAMTASAQTGDFGLRAGYQRLADGDGGGSALGGFFRWDWHRVVMFEAALLYHVEEVDGAATNAATDIEFIPVQFSAMIYPLRRDYQFSPYLLAGVGVYITRAVQTGVDSESDFDFGWHLGLGLDMNLNERVFLEGDFRYIWLDTQTDNTTIRDAMASFDSWMATVGIGFRL
jgi:outer membrane protein W